MPRSKAKPPSKLPSKADLLEYIQESPARLSKRDIARAFNVKSTALKAILKELEQDGLIERKTGRRYAELGRLPEVAVLIGDHINTDGELIVRPASWDASEPAPLIYVLSSKVAGRAIGVGDRILARLSSAGDGTYEARPIRRLSGGARQVLGILERTDKNRFIPRPTDRRDRLSILIERQAASDAKHGELVLATVEGSGRKGTVKGKVIERLHHTGIEKALSLIAIHSHNIPHQWSQSVEDEAARCGPVKLVQREDLRSIPLVTIDGEDARDFDDAVWCEADPDPKNKGGWHIIVAIADVSWYVRPGSPLDRAAFERSNSTYFPERVVPMLPEALSNNWCSLKPNEDRPCLAVHLLTKKECAGIIPGLVVHRALIGVLKLGPGDDPDNTDAKLKEVADHISMTERRSALAEQETVDRFTAAYLSEEVGAEFSGQINGVSRFGVFVTLTDTGADGLVPMKRLLRDRYDVIEEQHLTEGRATGTVFSLGDPMTVRLVEADALTGSLVFEYVAHEPLRSHPTAPRSTLKRKSKRSGTARKNRGKKRRS